MITYTGKINYIKDQAEVLNEQSLISEIRSNIKKGDIYIVKNGINSKKVHKIREYLTQIGKSSLPNYLRIEKGCPNFHRINLWDERSYVKACFHQFVFFPWNQDVFNLFDLLKETYHMRNLINGVPKEDFLGNEPDNGCIARLAFQFYPKGMGGMNKHSDPIDFHQLTVPIITMSEKGKDFVKGGAYVERDDGKKIMLDEISEVGDVVYFHAQMPHGVETIDPDAEKDWLSFEGRWMLLVAVNKLFDNTDISNAIDLENKRVRVMEP